MQRLPNLMRLVFARPKLSDHKIGQHVGRTAQTVRRYINLIACKRITWDHVKDLDGPAIDRLLNARRGGKRKRPIDLDAVDAVLTRPGATPRDAWRAYAQVDPEDAVCYVQFLRTYRAARPWRPPAQPRRAQPMSRA